MAEPQLGESDRSRIMAATVRIVVDEKQSTGSGVLIAIAESNVWILTARHVVADSRECDAAFFSIDKEIKVSTTLKRGRIVERSQDADLALVRFDLPLKTNLALPLTLAESASKEKGFAAVGCGISQDGVPSIEPATVLGRKLLQRPDKTSAFFWEAKEAPEQGRSGGPLTTLDGKLIGITSGKQDDRGYFTHLDEVRAFLKKAKIDQ